VKREGEVGNVSTMMGIATTDAVLIEGVKNGATVGSEVNGCAGVGDAVRPPDRVRIRRIWIGLRRSAEDRCNGTYFEGFGGIPRSVIVGHSFVACGF
jgi:hypothetical protein